MSNDVKDIGTVLSLSNPRRVLERYLEQMPDDVTAVAVIGVTESGELVTNRGGVTRKDMLWALENMRADILELERRDIDED